jgi:hypothetical protein
MKSAPSIVVAEIQDVKFVSNEPREVDKPPGIGGPVVPRIPLYLARMSAKVMLTLRGTETHRVQFYSCVWASGKHGGPRLFHVSPGSVHVLFLRNDSGYLHTVGDYPSYDLELRTS